MEMTILDFTVEETNLIAIYKDGTKAATLQNIADALQHMDDEMRGLAESATRKLAALASGEFEAIPFTPADDTDEA